MHGVSMVRFCINVEKLSYSNMEKKWKVCEKGGVKICMARKEELQKRLELVIDVLGVVGVVVIGTLGLLGTDRR